MSQSVRISLDAMGGDHGPSTVVPGAAIARERHPETSFLLFGDEAVKEAARILRETEIATLAYHGFVEGNDLGKGTVDVVVTEGFTGNIALKTAEGTAKQIGSYLRSAMSRTLMAKIGYLFARQAFTALREKMNPSRANGGVFLGLEGIVIKSHGSENAQGFAAAIDLAHDMARHDLMRTIRDMLDQAPAAITA